MHAQSLPDWARPFTRSCSQECDRRVLVEALRILASGRPASASALSRKLRLSPEEVRSALKRLPDAEFDPDGSLIAYGLSLRPTKHRFRVAGRTLYTWCAWDALVLPPLLNRVARVRSDCPVSGAAIRIVVGPSEIQSLVPEEAVVSLLPPGGSEGGRSVRASFCAHSHFFRSAREAESSSIGGGRALTIPVRRAFAVGRSIEC